MEWIKFLLIGAMKREFCDVAVMVPIIGFSTVIAMLGVVLMNQRRELEARRRAEGRWLRELNKTNNENAKGSLP